MAVCEAAPQRRPSIHRTNASARERAAVTASDARMRAIRRSEWECGGEAHAARGAQRGDTLWPSHLRRRFAARAARLDSGGGIARTRCILPLCCPRLHRRRALCPRCAHHRHLLGGGRCKPPSPHPSPQTSVLPPPPPSPPYETLARAHTPLRPCPLRAPPAAAAHVARRCAGTARVCAWGDGRTGTTPALC